MTERDVYTTSLVEQSAQEALNSILWRLAVATGLTEVGDSFLEVNPDEVLALAEEYAWRYRGLSK